MKATVQIRRGIESLFGTRDENIRLIENALSVRTRLLNDSLEVEGEEPDVHRAVNILSDYAALVQEGHLFNNGDPDLRPLYDALYDMLEADKVEKLLERNTIEVAPIAFMRGRTLNDSFIIMDEAQNATPEQMKMILTRQGFNSKMVVTGDVTQIDLPNSRRSGLLDAVEVLKG